MDIRFYVLFHKIFPFLAVLLVVLILEIKSIIYKYNDTFYGVKSILKPRKKTDSNQTRK